MGRMTQTLLFIFWQSDQQLDCALDLMRRLPPQQIEKNLSDLIDLVGALVVRSHLGLPYSPAPRGVQTTPDTASPAGRHRCLTGLLWRGEELPLAATPPERLCS